MTITVFYTYQSILLDSKFSPEVSCTVGQKGKVGFLKNVNDITVCAVPVYTSTVPPVTELSTTALHRI